MRRTKRLAALLIAFAMLFTLLPLATAGAASLSGNIVLTMNSTEFTVNGTKTKIDAEGSKPAQTKGYTMLPLRAILEATGGTLKYDANTKKITITRGGDTVVLTLDSKTAVVNGANRTLGAAPYATNGRTMVHIRTLELFGMRVDWDSKTNKVTVNYIEPTKVYNLTLQNGMSTAYTGIYLAPDGTAAGAAAESGNLLGSDTLPQNGSIIVQAPISTPGNYQLRCTYVDPLSKATQTHTIRNVNLTGITDRATVLMNSATSPSVTVDGASVGNATITLYLLNNTGNTISAVYYRQTGAQYYERTNLLGSQTLANGGQTSCSFTYNTNSPYYDFVASYTTNETVTYNRVQIGANVGSLGFQTLRLGSNGTIDGSTTATTKVETKLTFENNSEDDIKGVILSTTDMSESKWEKADTTFGKISADKSKNTTIDISESRRWYVAVLDEDGDFLYSERLDFGSTNVKSATITWDGDELECDADDNSDDDDDSDFDGDTNLLIINNTEDSYKAIIAVPEATYNKSSFSDKYSSAKSKGVQLGKLNKNSYAEYEDALEYNKDEYVLLCYESTGSSDTPDTIIEDIYVSKSSKYIIVTLDDEEVYDADDDMVLLTVKNSSGEDIDLDIRDESDDDLIESWEVSNKETVTDLFDAEGASKIYFDIEGDESKDVKISSSAPNIISVTVSTNSKDEYTFSIK